MRVAPQNKFDVLKLESELLDGILNGRDIPFEDRVDQNMTLRRGDKEWGQTLGSHVVQVSDDLVRGKLLVLLFRVAHVPPE